MIELNPVTGKLVQMALDASQMRLDVIANNIANANTPEYKAMGISFEQRLTTHKAALLDKNNDATNIAVLEQNKPEAVAIYDSDGIGKTVLIDQQLMELSKSVLHYQALLDANSKRGSIIKMAITGSTR